MEVILTILSILGILFFLWTFKEKWLLQNGYTKMILKNYEILINESSKIERVILLLFYVFINGGVVYLVGNQLKIGKGINLWNAFLMAIFLIVLIFYVIGILLLSFERMQRLFCTGANKALRNRYTIGILLLLFYSIMVFGNKNLFLGTNIVHFIGVFVAYYCNVYTLIHISQEPLSVFCDGKISSDKEQRSILKIMLFMTILLIFFIVVCLYLGVFLIHSTFTGSYYNMVNKLPISNLDLFYYTVISFTTIGYGEIVPVRIESKIMGVIIAFTSVLCLCILVSSIMGLKGKFKS